MSDEADGRRQPTDGTESHDPDFPETFLAVHAHGLARHRAARRRPAPEAPNHAKRRAALSAAFPGETLVIPTGTEKVRANDTDYPFRPGQRLRLADRRARPGRRAGAAPERRRPRRHPVHAAPLLRGTPTSSSAAAHGELWVGRRHTLAEKSTELGIAHRRPGRRWPRRWPSCAPGRTRVLRGFDPGVDAAVRRTTPTEAGSPRPGAGHRASPSCKLVKDEWEIAQLQDAIDATVRGFEDVARVLPADRAVSERLIEGVFGLRARHDGNDVGYGSIVGAGAHATILHWVRNTRRAPRPAELLLMDMGVENRNLYTADVTRTLPVSRHVHRRCSARSTTSCTPRSRPASTRSGRAWSSRTST